MTETHSYFGDPALFSVLNLPADGQVRGGVLLCGALGKEGYDTVRGMRRLAEELAERGLAVLRFDYHATGDSAGSHGAPDAVTGWIESITEAYRHLRSLGIRDIAVVGLRAGALLATQAISSLPDVHAAVLWDPVSGRRWLREQAALFLLAAPDTEPPSDDGQVAILGMELHADAARHLKSLTLTGPPCTTLLVGRTGEGAIAPVEPSDIGRVELVEAAGVRQFVTPDSFLVAIPYAAIDLIVQWLDPLFGSETVQVQAPSRREATVSPAGEPEVVERIERIEPDGMFAIRSLPGPAQGPESPLRNVVLYTTANDTHHGPGREWVELARQCAASGAGALRFDRLGVGESGPVADDEITPIYSQAARAQTVAAARHAGADPRQMLAAGVCSGSWYAASVARRLGLDHVVLINAVAWSWRRKRSAEGAVLPEDLGVPRSDPQWQRSFRGRVKHQLSTRLPYVLWRALGQRGITQVPEVLLGKLARAGVQATVLLCQADLAWFTAQRGPEGVARLRRRALPAPITAIPGDHSAFHPAARAAVRRTVLDWVRSASGR